MKTYHIITIGCQMNKSDSERIAGQLEKSGYRRSDNKYQADLVVINTCGVRQSAENRAYGLIPGIKKQNKKVKIILTGCLVKREDVRKRLKNYVDLWLPITQIFNFPARLASQSEAGRQFPISKILPTPFVKGEKCSDYLKIIPKYKSKFSAFVPIGNGCDNYCSYCVVPYARGREIYRPAKDILNEVRGLAKMGYKEIVLIAQNVNSYKSRNSQLATRNSKTINFADLLKVVNNIPGDFWIRFATSHPKDMSDKLIKTMAQGQKICHHLHLPVQAGDDAVLKRMNRQYTSKDYMKLVKKIRKQLNPPYPPLLKGALWNPPPAITTDIIVGFPGETKKQFNNTAKLMHQIKFDLAYIAQYSPRPETVAAKLADNISRPEKKRREEVLMRILRKTALANNKKYLGKIVKVLVEGKNKRGELFGSTETAKTVKLTIGDFNQRFPRNDKLIGKFVNIEITKARDFGLVGVIVKNRLV